MHNLEIKPSSVEGGVRLILRLEGLCVLLLALLAYARFGSGWGMFALLFLVPDLSMLGYVMNAKAGAVLYNLAHAYPCALLLLGIGMYFDVPTVLAAGMIWAAHIGFDRMLGYGLKYSAGFRFTHLGTIGRQSDRT